MLLIFIQAGLWGLLAGAGLVVGFFLANVPQGLSSAAGMKQAGRSAKYIFSVCPWP